MNTPEGWKLVPVEPSEEMITAGCGEGDEIYGSAFIRAYNAALAAAPTPTIKAYWPESSQAAPTPPAQEDEPVAYVPVHPRNGPLWANTTAEPNQERLPSYPLMSLYTRPDNLRKAAEEALRLLNGDCKDIRAVEENLRAALEGK